MDAERKAQLALAVALVALAVAIASFAGLVMYSLNPQPAWSRQQ